MSGGEDSRPGKFIILVGWGLLGCVLFLIQGPPPVACLRPQRTVVDFFQDWASAKLFFSGRSIYGSQQKVYREWTSGTDDRTVSNQVNAHPPPAVLLTLPLGLLDYPDACLVWNLLSILALGVSMWLILSQLNLQLQLEGWVALVVLVGWCFPLWDQLCSGQFNLVLLLLITLAWVFERLSPSSPPSQLFLAGFCLGSATAIKFIPGFLFLYFLLQRRWWALVGGLVAGLCWVVLSVGVFGMDVFTEYIQEGMPHASSFRDAFPNVSLPAFWNKLFAGTGQGGHARSLWDQPGLARIGIAGSWLLVAGSTVWRCWGARTRAQCDHSFALCLTAMLLLSPTTWPHYFLLLLLPMVLLWRDLSPHVVVRCVFWVSVAILCVRPYLYWDPLLHINPGNWYRKVSEPWETITVISLPTYALLGVFVLGMLVSRRKAP